MTLILVLITEVSSIQRSFNTLQNYTGTQNGVLIIEVSATQRFVIERFHCIHTNRGSDEERETSSNITTKPLRTPTISIQTIFTKLE